MVTWITGTRDELVEKLVDLLLTRPSNKRSPEECRRLAAELIDAKIERKYITDSLTGS